MPFATSLAQGLAGIVQDQTAQLRQKQDRERRDAERQAAQDRLFSQQEKLAQMKMDAKNAFKAASPELQAAIDKGDFQTASQIAMRDPNDAKHWKSYWQTFGQKHYEAAYGPGVTKEKEAARQAESTKGFEERRKIAAANPIASKKATGGKGTTARGSGKQEKAKQAELVRALKAKVRQLDKEIQATADDVVDDPDKSTWYRTAKKRIPGERKKQMIEMRDGYQAQIDEIELRPLADLEQAKPETLLAPPDAGAPELIPNPIQTPSQKPKLMPAPAPATAPTAKAKGKIPANVSPGVAAILKKFEEFK